MPDAANSDELRALQERAYSRDGELTPDEARRLRELQRRRPSTSSEEGRAAAAPARTTARTASTPAGATRSPHPTADTAQAREPAGDDRRTAASHAAIADSPPRTGARPRSGRGDTHIHGAQPDWAEGLFDAPSPPLGTTTAAAPASSASAAAGSAYPHGSRQAASALDTIRAAWRPLALGALASLAIGLGAGWMFFGRPAPAAAVELSAVQQQWEAEIIASDDFDAGSLQPVYADDIVAIWAATREGSDSQCIVLADGEKVRQNCEPNGAPQGVWGSIVIDTSEGQRQIDGQILRTASGEPAVAVSNSVRMTDAGRYGTPEEEAAAAEIAAQGFDPNSLWIVGYDGEIAIWVGTDEATNEQCLIVGAAPAEVACADAPAGSEGTPITLTRVDSETGETASYRLGQPYMDLTIERTVYLEAPAL